MPKISPTKYYWLCSYPLEEGSIVLPGNWGRIISLYWSDGGLLIYLREKILEDIRKEKFSSRPSRLTSFFLCKSEVEAKTFQTLSGSREFDILYEVELVDDKPIFETDWSFVNFPNMPFLLKDLEPMAYKYWQAENIQNPEVLTESRIKIVRRCN